MADAHRRSAVHGLALPNRAGEISITDAGPVIRLVYRGAADGLGDAFGYVLPIEPLRAVGTSTHAALWLGPDEWLLIAPDDSARLQHLQARLAGKPASLVDVSHRNIGLTITGPRAADVLASACPLDFDLSAFPVGMCTRTIFGKAEVMLWRTGPQTSDPMPWPGTSWLDTFRLEAGRSFAPYVTALLAEAVAGLP